MLRTLNLYGNLWKSLEIFSLDTCWLVRLIGTIWRSWSATLARKRCESLGNLVFGYFVVGILSTFLGKSIFLNLSFWAWDLWQACLVCASMGNRAFYSCGHWKTLYRGSFRQHPLECWFGNPVFVNSVLQTLGTSFESFRNFFWERINTKNQICEILSDSIFGIFGIFSFETVSLWTLVKLYIKPLPCRSESWKLILGYFANLLREPYDLFGNVRTLG